jgi:hypothetical protein
MTVLLPQMRGLWVSVLEGRYCRAWEVHSPAPGTVGRYLGAQRGRMKGRPTALAVRLNRKLARTGRTTNTAAKAREKVIPTTLRE